MKYIFTSFVLVLFTISLGAQEYYDPVIPWDDADTVFAEASDPNDTDLRLKESSDVKVKVYPNPVQEQPFTTVSNQNIRSINIYNILGKQVYAEKFAPGTNQIKISLERENQGMYIMKITHYSGADVVHRIRRIQ